MSGHNKWSKIKRKKAAEDQKRSKIFSQLVREIKTAVRENGDDPETNAALRSAIDRARAENMPKENIQRAIDRGAGRGETGALKTARYEAYGPSGVAILIEVETDNTNRVVADIKHAVQESGGSLAEPGSVAWLFEKKGVVVINTEDIDSDKLERLAIEADAEDIRKLDGAYYIITAPGSFQGVKKTLAEHASLVGAEVRYIPTTLNPVQEQAQKELERLISALEGIDDVEAVYSNSEAL